MRTYTCWNLLNSTNPCDASQSSLMWINNANGNVFVHKFMRYMIGYEYTINFGYAGTWRPGPYNPAGWEGDAFNYVIYEKDQWPTGKKSTDIDNQGFITSYDYRSADLYYDKGIILFWGVPGTHMNGYSRDISGEIKFNSRL